MKKRKKYFKVLLTFVLVVALFTVQGLQIAANAKADLSNPTILVSDYEQFMDAVQNAQDGDVIGINGSIEIKGENAVIGSDDKHIYFVRVYEFGMIRVINNGSITMKNVTLDGGGRPGEGAMLYVEQGGHLTLNNVTFQKCDANYGAIYLNSNSIAEINSCVFDSNYASSGGHIYVNGSVQIANCSFTNGYVYDEGGAIYISSSGTATISSSVICNNTSRLYGGGISNNGTLVIDNTVIYDNTAPNGSDIANTKTSQFQIDSLDDVRSLYEARNIVPKEWALDSNNLISRKNYTQPAP